MFYFCKSNEKWAKCPKIATIKKMKDRIRQIMESQHMSQQIFADFIGIAPATLSGIFTERTKPTLNTVDAIKKKLPNLSTDWLMFGKGQMYVDQQADSDSSSSGKPTSSSFEPQLDFAPSYSPTPQNVVRPGTSQTGMRNTRVELSSENMNNFDKTPRKVTEIRVFYDDQTWESFVPAKK